MIKTTEEKGLKTAGIGRFGWPVGDCRISVGEIFFASYPLFPFIPDVIQLPQI